MIYPIAETFHSIQGEGLWVGTPMYFVRLAGCNVGKYITPASQQPWEGDANSLRVLRASYPDHSVCKSWTGDAFLCDTNYKKHEEIAHYDLLAACSEKHLCITGGEPFLHNLSPLVWEAQERGITVHIETSGTLAVIDSPHCWITCSPKEGFLKENAQHIDEWKFVVGPATALVDIEAFLQALGEKEISLDSFLVYLQPINGVNGHDKNNLHRVLDMLKLKPAWKLSAQLHKYLEMR